MPSLPLPGRRLDEGTPTTFTSLDGSVTLFVDPEDETFYIDARVGYDAAWLGVAIDQAKAWGLEVLDENECPAEALDNGTVRRRLCPSHAPLLKALSGQVTA